MKILKEINNEYELFKKYDKDIDNLNKLKEQKLKNIIELLKQIDFLKLIKNIEGVKSAQLNIYCDAENSNWKELELTIYTNRKSNEFDDYDDYIHYENNIRSQIYLFLDKYPNLNDFMMVYIER